MAELDDWQPFDGASSYRLIVSRMEHSDDQADLFSRQAYTWRAILTADWDTSSKQIVAFYNKGGDSERLFDVMNNDFGWSRLPCSFLSENTASIAPLVGVVRAISKYDMYSTYQAPPFVPCLGNHCQKSSVFGKNNPKSIYNCIKSICMLSKPKACGF